MNFIIIYIQSPADDRHAKFPLDNDGHERVGVFAQSLRHAVSFGRIDAARPHEARVVDVRDDSVVGHGLATEASRVLVFVTVQVHEEEFQFFFRLGQHLVVGADEESRMVSAVRSVVLADEGDYVRGWITYGCGRRKQCINFVINGMND